MKRSIVIMNASEEENFEMYIVLKGLDLFAKISFIHNTTEAMKFLYLEHVCPDFVFVSLSIPDLDGYEFIRAFNEADLFGRAEKPKIFILLEEVEKTDIKKLIDLGITGLLVKPLSRESLSITINNYVNDLSVTDTNFHKL